MRRRVTQCNVCSSCEQGDDGSGVICNQRLCGIMSFSYSSELKHQTFYTNIYNYLDWIESVAQEHRSYDILEQASASAWSLPTWAKYIIIIVIVLIVCFMLIFVIMPIVLVCACCCCCRHRGFYQRVRLFPSTSQNT